jgi:folate-dependent phosphoribosylglycinamide formyltransferase PurN
MRIAVICDDDRIWALSTWERTLPQLTERDLCPVGLWVCPPALSRYKGWKIHLYYLNSFGVLDFTKLALFAGAAIVTRWFGALTDKRSVSFKQLAQKHHIYFDRCSSPNDSRFIAWIRDQKIDILIIWVGHILENEVLAAPQVGTINRHAALLPANRGLFPYFWARLKGTRQGISFHEVVRGIDKGRVLVQEEIIASSSQRSMIAFYWHVAQRYPYLLLSAISSLAESRFLLGRSDVEDGYFGLPTPADVRLFREKDGKVVLWRDVIYGAKI